MVALLSAGQTPPPIRPWMASGSLTPLWNMTTIFAPSQWERPFGDPQHDNAAPGGAVSVLRPQAVRWQLASTACRGRRQLDLENAFNEVNRSWLQPWPLCVRLRNGENSVFACRAAGRLSGVLTFHHLVSMEPSTPAPLSIGAQWTCLLTDSTTAWLAASARI